MKISEKKYNTIVFCDFDGTITTEDAFVNVCKQFAPKETDTFLHDIFHGGLTLREGIKRIVESIPSSKYLEMLDSVNQSEIRPGFVECLDFLDHLKIPLVVISGGLKGLVERQLSQVRTRVEAVHAAEVDLAGEKIKIVSKFENGTELVNKKQVMSHYSYNRAVAIGDGITDHNMAISSDIVFARKHLALFLDKKKHSYYKWEDFFDIKKRLETINL